MNSTLKDLVGLIACMPLKDRIKEALDRSTLSKSEFARATKSTPGAVTQWLSGETKSLKAEKAQLIELATGYSSSWLVSGKGAKLAFERFEANQAEAIAKNAQAAINSIATDVRMLMRVLDAMPPDVRSKAANAALAVLVQHLPPTSEGTPKPERDTIPASTLG